MALAQSQEQGLVGLTRSACDRCRQQKLRCDRIDNAGACNRCLRKGSQCVYSSGLARGRRTTQANSDRRHDGGSGETAETVDGAANQSSLESMEGNSLNHPVDSMDMDWNSLQYDLGTSEDINGSDPTSDWFALVDTTLPLDVLPPTSPLATTDPGPRPDHLIEQLAQLSMQLSSLRHTMGNLLLAYSPGSFKAKEIYQRDSSILQSVTKWLTRNPSDVGLSTPISASLGDILYGLFDASYRLLELVKPLVTDGSSTPSTVSTSSVGADFVHDKTFAPASLDSTVSSDLYAKPLRSWSTSSTSSINTPTANNSVVMHLLFSNHTMLIGMYAEIVEAMKGERTTPHQDGKCSRLCDIGIVLALRLCAYFVDHQHRVVGLWMDAPHNQPHGLKGLVGDANQRSMEDMKGRIEQQMRDLQQTMQI